MLSYRIWESGAPLPAMPGIGSCADSAGDELSRRRHRRSREVKLLRDVTNRRSPDLDYRAEMSSIGSPSTNAERALRLEHFALDHSRQAVELGLSLIRSKSVGGGWDDEFMTGDDQDGDQNGDQHDSTTARQAVADARREAAAAAARLAEAAVRYADLRIAEDTTDAPASDCAGPKRPKPG